MDLNTVRDELKRLFGLPPYNNWSNHAAFDAYYAKSLEVKYGMTILQLSDLTGVKCDPRKI